MTLAVSVRPRLVEFDRIRGLAILLMIGDHLAIAAANPLYRVTAGRVAMPLFFIVAGYFAGRRLTCRHLLAFGLGLALPVLVPFVDSPNVLVWWALGSVVLWGFARLSWPVWPLVAVALTFAANGWAIHLGELSYDPAALLALMALGRLLPGSAFSWGGRLPEWMGSMGRHPLAWYVGHAVALEFFLVVIGRG